MERNRDLSGAFITSDKDHTLMIPIMSSCTLLLMFYLFSSVSQLLTAFTAMASASSLFFCLLLCVIYVKSQFGLAGPFVLRCCSKSFKRTQGMLLLVCCGTVAAWPITGHWILNNLLGISICVAMFAFPISRYVQCFLSAYLCMTFWVFYSERFFGANVMASVATLQASNPVHTVANSLSLPGLQLITKKLEMPVKIMFPRHLLGGVLPGTTAVDFMMLGLGDMAIPAMVLALILCFDYGKSREIVSLKDLHSSKRHIFGNLNIQSNILTLIFSLVFMVIQVPSTLGPVILLSWMRREPSELWEGNPPSTNDKDSSAEV